MHQLSISAFLGAQETIVGNLKNSKYLSLIWTWRVIIYHSWKEQCSFTNLVGIVALVREVPGGPPYISQKGIAMCYPKRYGFCAVSVLKWVYRLFLFWSGTGYAFRENYGSVWTYLSFRERIICEFEIDFKKSFCCFCCSNLSNDYIISAHNGWQGWIETWKNWANIFKFYTCKNRQKIVMVNAPWWNLFDILLISLTDR